MNSVAVTVHVLMTVVVVEIMMVLYVAKLVTYFICSTAMATAKLQAKLIISLVLI